MIKTVIIDDEPLAREGLELLCSLVPDIHVDAMYSSAIAASTYIITEQPDLILMDIQMPGIDGLSFLRSLNRKQQVIITTAYPQYAVEAYELDAIDYLVKPVKEERFLKAINRARPIIEYWSKSTEPENTKIQDNEIYIKSERRYVKLLLNDILFIKGLKDYVIIHTKTDRHITAMNIKTILSHLPEKVFARISKSYIINATKINTIEHDTVQIGSEIIPIGNIFKEPFLTNFVKNKTLKR